MAIASAMLVITATPGSASVPANSGLPGSACVANDGGIGYWRPTHGEKTNGLGPDAPAYYEMGAPTGAFAGKPAKGVMLVIHGGGWHLVGKATVAYERRHADPWRARGWETVNVDYRGCAQSLADVTWFEQRVELLNPGARICVEGVSAGGQLALMLAATQPRVACVVSLGGVTDFEHIAGQTAYDFRSGTYDNVGPAAVFNLGAAAFGAQLGHMSPINFAAAIDARLLIASGAGDPLIPVAQGTDMAAAMFKTHSDAYVDVDLLPMGTMKFVHTSTTQDALDDLNRREDALVAGLSPKPVPPLLSLL
ncbi:MAG TPA: prolyl oligopeptidase family serine peptidase [Acidimicrobiales bacterium]|nr:prolyl oligopeptidase family serine peptidase [Acidimicrobiales bacterium]